jgi:dipeptidyl aminopeptidase/acylaminoacyl peptidase
VRAVREVADPIDMSTDWLNIMHWVHGEPQRDPDRLGIWGSSMAGGYVIYTAAHESRVKAVHRQVTGGLNGRAMGRSTEARVDRANEQHQGPKNLVLIPGVSHYDIYGEPGSGRMIWRYPGSIST